MHFFSRECNRENRLDTEKESEEIESTFKKKRVRLT